MGGGQSVVAITQPDGYARETTSLGERVPAGGGRVKGLLFIEDFRLPGFTTGCATLLPELVG